MAEGNVIPFARTVPHLVGEARCTSCRHDWQAATPVGTDWLDCPGCGLFKGRFLHPAVPDVGRWMCGCGCDAFAITSKAAFCIGCGTEQEFKS